MEAHFSTLALTTSVIFELCVGGGWFCKLSCKVLEGKGELPEYSSALTCALSNIEVLILKEELGNAGRQAGGTDKNKRVFLPYAIL